jgi:hypothetical protein
MKHEWQTLWMTSGMEHALNKTPPLRRTIIDTWRPITLVFTTLGGVLKHDTGRGLGSPMSCSGLPSLVDGLRYRNQHVFGMLVDAQKYPQ